MHQTIFRFWSIGLNEKDFEKPEMVIQLGQPPVRIDLITSITGESWQEAYANKIESSNNNISIFFISRSDLIKNKKSIDRKKDQADIEALNK